MTNLPIGETFLDRPELELDPNEPLLLPVLLMDVEPMARAAYDSFMEEFYLPKVVRKKFSDFHVDYGNVHAGYTEDGIIVGYRQAIGKVPHETLKHMVVATNLAGPYNRIDWQVHEHPDRPPHVTPTGELRAEFMLLCGPIDLPTMPLIDTSTMSPKEVKLRQVLFQRACERELEQLPRLVLSSAGGEFGFMGNARDKLHPLQVISWHLEDRAARRARAAGVVLANTEEPVHTEENEHPSRNFRLLRSDLV